MSKDQITGFIYSLKTDLSRKERRKLNTIVKIIIVEKILKGITLLLLSLSFIPVFSDDVISYLHIIAKKSHLLSNARFLTHLFTRIEGLSDKRHLILSIFFLFWGALELSEGIGLVKNHRWAEYLIVVTTSLFIPIEVSTVLARFTVEKLILLLFNIFLVYYFIWSRKLFVFEKND